MRRVLRVGFSACVLIGIAACSSTPEWTQTIGWNAKNDDGATTTATTAEAPDAATAASAAGSTAAPAWLPGIAPAAGETPREDTGQPGEAETAAGSDAADQGVWSPRASRVVRDTGDKDTSPTTSGPKPVSASSGKDASLVPPDDGAAAAHPRSAAKIRGTLTAALPSGDGAQAGASRARPSPAPAGSSSAAPASAADADAFVKRGDQLLQTGDIIGARLCYERAVAGGIAAAATKVGMTYDPLYLAEAGVQGLHGDPAEAAQWYRKGISAGDPEALQRLSALSQTLLR